MAIFCLNLHPLCSCFLSHVGVFWGAFLAPIFAIMLFNVVLFVCIIVVLIRHIRSRSLRTTGHVDYKDVIHTAFSIFGLICLFGLTWLFAVFTFSVPGLRETFQLLFTIFNSLQGAFVFLYICVFSSEVRDRWKLYFNHRKSTHLTHLSQHIPSKQYATCTETKIKYFGMSVPNPLLKVSYLADIANWHDTAGLLLLVTFMHYTTTVFNFIGHACEYPVNHNAKCNF